jgi:ribonuclease P protein component
MTNHSFSKSERLTNSKPIEFLFNSGESINCFPFKVLYRISINIDKDFSCAQAAFVVPKRLFKKAVDRNNIKRKMKEAYRKNKHKLYNELNNKNQKLEFVVIYIANENIEFSAIENKMLVLIESLIKTARNKKDWIL